MGFSVVDTILSHLCFLFPLVVFLAAVWYCYKPKPRKYAPSEPSRGKVDEKTERPRLLSTPPKKQNGTVTSSFSSKTWRTMSSCSSPRGMSSSPCSHGPCPSASRILSTAFSPSRATTTKSRCGASSKQSTHAS